MKNHIFNTLKLCMLFFIKKNTSTTIFKPFFENLKNIRYDQNYLIFNFLLTNKLYAGVRLVFVNLRPQFCGEVELNLI